MLAGNTLEEEEEEEKSAESGLSHNDFLAHSPTKPLQILQNKEFLWKSF